jgi:hypothetical protein
MVWEAESNVGGVRVRRNPRSRLEEGIHATETVKFRPDRGPLMPLRTLVSIFFLRQNPSYMNQTRGFTVGFKMFTGWAVIRALFRPKNQVITVILLEF